jgi:hypothetical protein
MSIEYREPSNLNELESLFRLRYAIYKDDPALHKMVQASAKHDINEFDLKALHYGAFENETPIAYIRIATDSHTHFAKWVNQIISSHKETPEIINSNFPFQNYYPDKKWSKDFVSSMGGKRVGEVGKLAIHKDYRKAGTILFGLIDSFIKYCKIEQNIETGFGSCTLKLARYYRKFGFTIVEGTQPFIYGDLPEAVIVKFGV